jgi:REP element-mobilizing transposase RayT
MANTYTQCHVHLVFAVKYRKALIQKSWKPDLEKYITGIVQNYEHKLLAIGGMPDHIHIFLGYNVKHLLPDLVSEIKTSSNAWVKENRLSSEPFAWQNGYGAFTHSRSQVPDVIKYVLNQEQNHAKKTFQKEYLEILAQNEVIYDEKYLFDFFDDVPYQPLSTNVTVLRT